MRCQHAPPSLDVFPKGVNPRVSLKDLREGWKDDQDVWHKDEGGDLVPVDGVCFGGGQGPGARGKHGHPLNSRSCMTGESLSKVHQPVMKVKGY